MNCTANYLNQLFNNCLLGCKFPVQWDNRKKFWFLHKPQNIQQSYYFRATILKLISVLVVTFSFLSGQAYGQISLDVFFVFGMECVEIVTTMVFDFVVYLDSAEVVNSCNWGYKQVSKRSSSSQNRYLKQFEYLASMLSFAFMFGFIQIGCVFSICVLHYDLDPLYVFTSQGENWLQAHGYFKAHFSIILMRCVTFNWLAQILASGLRTMFVCAAIGGLNRGKLLFWMSNQQLKLPLINLYRQCYIYGRVMNDFDYKVSSISLVLSFVFIISGVFIALLGQKIGALVLLALGMVAVCGASVLLQCFFAIGCGYFENSQNVLIRWTANLAEGGYSRSTRKELKSLRPVALPAGNVGIG